MKKYVMMIRHSLMFLACIIFLVTCSNLAESQARTWAGQPDNVLLARTCWSEAGFWEDDEFSNVEDCAAIAEVIRYIAERNGMHFREAWRSASPSLASGDVEREWLAHLHEDGRRPRGFDMPWETVWQPRWHNLVDLSAAILRGDIDSSCEEQPRAWGNYHDIRLGRARGRARWVEIDCGDTVNHFGRWEPL